MICLGAQKGESYQMHLLFVPHYLLTLTYHCNHSLIQPVPLDRLFLQNKILLLMFCSDFFYIIKEAEHSAYCWNSHDFLTSFCIWLFTTWPYQARSASKSVLYSTQRPEGRCPLFREHWPGTLDLVCLCARDRSSSKAHQWHRAMWKHRQYKRAVL